MHYAFWRLVLDAKKKKTNRVFCNPLVITSPDTGKEFASRKFANKICVLEAEKPVVCIVSNKVTHLYHTTQATKSIIAEVEGFLKGSKGAKKWCHIEGSGANLVLQASTVLGLKLNRAAVSPKGVIRTARVSLAALISAGEIEFNPPSLLGKLRKIFTSDYIEVFKDPVYDGLHEFVDSLIADVRATLQEVMDEYRARMEEANKKENENEDSDEEKGLEANKGVDTVEEENENEDADDQVEEEQSENEAEKVEEPKARRTKRVTTRPSPKQKAASATSSKKRKAATATSSKKQKAATATSSKKQKAATATSSKKQKAATAKSSKNQKAKTAASPPKRKAVATLTPRKRVKVAQLRAEKIVQSNKPLMYNLKAGTNVFLVPFGAMWFATSSPEEALVLKLSLQKLFVEADSANLQCPKCPMCLPTNIDLTWHLANGCKPLPESREKMWCASFPTAFYCNSTVIEFLHECVEFEGGPQPLLNVFAHPYFIGDGRGRHAISSGSREVTVESNNCTSDTATKSLLALIRSKLKWLLENPRVDEEAMAPEILLFPFLLPYAQWPQQLRDTPPLKRSSKR